MGQVDFEKISSPVWAPIRLITVSSSTFCINKEKKIAMSDTCLCPSNLMQLVKAKDNSYKCTWPFHLIKLALYS